MGLDICHKKVLDNAHCECLVFHVVSINVLLLCTNRHNLTLPINVGDEC
jgi:hypothetical protein